MTTRTLLAALTTGLIAHSAVGLDINDLTFTGLFLPTDASTNAEVVVGYQSGAISFPLQGDIFSYDRLGNNFYLLNGGTSGYGSDFAEVSYDGTRISGGVNTPDFGGDTSTTFDGPFLSIGVWEQTTGIGTGNWTDLLENQQPVPSYAQENWSQYDPLNPGSYTPTAFDRNLGNGRGISGDGSTVVGSYYRATERDPVTNEITLRGGGWAFGYNVDTDTMILPDGQPAPSIDGANGAVQATNFDGSVLGGYVRNNTPAVWNDAGELTILTHADGNTGRVEAISDDGTVLAGYQRAVVGSTGSTTEQMVRWVWDDTAEQWDRQALGRLDESVAQGQGQALGMSADGSIVVGWERTDRFDQLGTGGTWNGTFWTENTGLVNIEDFLTARGVDLTGLDITRLTGIAPDGDYLLAVALAGGEQTGIIIDLTDTPLNPLGDTNLLQALLERFGGTAEYAGDTYTGDWNHDQLVTAADLDILLRNWDPALGTPPTIDVPEPGSLALLLGVGGLALRRRRRH